MTAVDTPATCERSPKSFLSSSCTRSCLNQRLFPSCKRANRLFPDNLEFGPRDFSLEWLLSWIEEVKTQKLLFAVPFLLWTETEPTELSSSEEWSRCGAGVRAAWAADALPSVPAAPLRPAWVWETQTYSVSQFPFSQASQRGISGTH